MHEIEEEEEEEEKYEPQLEGKLQAWENLLRSQARPVPKCPQESPVDSWQLSSSKVLKALEDFKKANGPTLPPPLTHNPQNPTAILSCQCSKWLKPTVGPMNAESQWLMDGLNAVYIFKLSGLCSNPKPNSTSQSYGNPQLP